MILRGLNEGYEGGRMGLFGSLPVVDKNHALLLSFEAYKAVNRSSPRRAVSVALPDGQA